VATQVTLATEYLTSPEVTCGKPPKLAARGTPTPPPIFSSQTPPPLLPFLLLAGRTLQCLTTPVNDDAWHALPHRGSIWFTRERAYATDSPNAIEYILSFFSLPPLPRERDLVCCVPQNSFLSWPPNVSILNFGQSLQRYVRFVFIARSRICL